MARAGRRPARRALGSRRTRRGCRRRCVEPGVVRAEAAAVGPEREEQHAGEALLAVGQLVVDRAAPDQRAARRPSARSGSSTCTNARIAPQQPRSRPDRRRRGQVRPRGAARSTTALARRRRRGRGPTRRRKSASGEVAVRRTSATSALDAGWSCGRTLSSTIFCATRSSTICEPDGRNGKPCSMVVELRAPAATGQRPVAQVEAELAAVLADEVQDGQHGLALRPAQPAPSCWRKIVALCVGRSNRMVSTCGRSRPSLKRSTANRQLTSRRAARRSASARSAAGVLRRRRRGSGSRRG